MVSGFKIESCLANKYFSLNHSSVEFYVPLFLGIQRQFVRELLRVPNSVINNLICLPCCIYLIL